MFLCKINHNYPYIAINTTSDLELCLTSKLVHPNHLDEPISSFGGS